MTPALAGFVTRADAGLIPPRSVSHRIDPIGVALHHGGDNVPVASHADCRRIWPGWQRYHMADRGWTDIAYTLGPCQHGYVFAGRGAGVRTAANGTTYGNDRFYAVAWLGGSRQTPTPEALAATAWAVAELRRHGAGDRVVGHSDLKLTTCPHPRILKLARDLDRRPIGDSMATDHQHAVPPSALPRSWGDNTWEEWVARSGTDPETRTWELYREDLGWVYHRVVAPLERQVADLSARVAELEARPSGGGGLTRAEADGLYVPRGYRLE